VETVFTVYSYFRIDGQAASTWSHVVLRADLLIKMRLHVVCHSRLIASEIAADGTD
jgi:hypothetical protein